MAKGVIYVCSTAVDGLIKIGKTTDFNKRMYELELNGYRNIAGLRRQFAIELEDYNEIENLLDDLFSKSRVGNTELFSIDLNKVIQLLSAFQGRQVYPTTETKKQVFERATDAIQTGLLPNGEYFLEVNQRDGTNSKATLLANNGKLILRRGATIANMRDSASDYIKKASDNLLVHNNILQEDTIFTSVSIAASVVLGGNTNGWTVWKDESGKLIDIYRQKNYIED